MGDPRGHHRTAAAAVVALFALLLLTSTAATALATVGHPFPSLFVDPYGDFSVVYLPAWGTADFGLRLADRCTVADGTPIARGHGVRPAAQLDAEVGAALGRGRTSMELQFSRNGASQSVAAPIRRMASAEVWWFYGLYAVVGMIILWIGTASFVLAGHRPGALANLALSLSAFTFLVTFFDYHTTRRFAPLFAASTFGNPISLCAVALYFPTSLELPSWLRRLLAPILALALGVGALLALDSHAMLDLRPLRLFVNVATVLGLVILGAAMAFRLRAAGPGERRQLVSAAWGLSLAPLALGVGFAINGLLGLGLFHLLLPIVIVLFPAAISYALVRHNILATDRILTRRIFAVPAVLCGFLISVSMYWVLGAMSDGLARTAAGWIDAVLFGVALGFMAWKLVERFAFASAERYRPSVEQLRDRLAREADPSEIRATLIEVVEKWLQAGPVEIVEPGAGERAGAPDLWRELGETERAFRAEGETRVLYAALRVRDRTLGALRILGKKGGAPFTSEDLTLIGTLASFGALGLQHAEAMQTVEELRRLEIGVSRAGQRLAVDTLSAEIAHDIQYPLTYFRHVLGQLAAGQTLEATDIDIGCEEVERLARMLEDLKRLQAPSYPLSLLDARPVLERAIVLLRQTAERRGVHIVLTAPSAVVVSAHPDPLLQLFANLLKNAILAVDPGGVVEIRVDDPSDAGIAVEIRDQGPGIPVELAPNIFRPWVTTRADGVGLGLAVASRIVRSFGWDLVYRRDEGWTVFRITAPRPTESLEERV